MRVRCVACWLCYDEQLQPGLRRPAHKKAARPDDRHIREEGGQSTADVVPGAPFPCGRGWGSAISQIGICALRTAATQVASAPRGPEAPSEPPKPATYE